jgi:purine-binding chemotaxis protein CheW
MDEIQIVNFTVCGVNYGVPVEQVREVRDMQAVTPIPGSDPCITGVTNLRGQIITLMDLRKRLSLTIKDGGSDKIIVIEMKNHAIGVLVDSVTEVSTLSGKDVEQNSELALGFDKYVIGVGKQNSKLVVLLDLIKIVQDISGNLPDAGDIRKLEQIAAAPKR